MVIRELDWLELPDHLTDFVTYKLSRCDFIRFGAVCKSWLPVYINHRRHSLPHQIPLLLLHNDQPGIHDVYDLGENRISTFQVSLFLTTSCYVVACGSNHGWLAIVWRRHSRTQICLTNPSLSRDNKIKLYPLRKIYDYLCDPVKKLVLSADPLLEPNFVAMVIMEGGEAAFLKHSSDRSHITYWNYLDSQMKLIDDVIHYRDQFYFVDISGTLYSCNVNHPCNPTKVFIVAPPPYSNFSHGNNDRTKYLYLVKLTSGELLLVKRLWKHNGNELNFYTIGFSAYKMNPMVEPKWTEMQNLCGETVFLDNYSSMSLQASEFPECKPNCIYFIESGYFYMDECGIRRPHDQDDYVNTSEYRPEYVGVYNLVDGTVTERFCLVENPTYCVTRRLPFWNEPTLVRHS